VALPSISDRGTASLLGVTVAQGKGWAVGTSTTGGAINRQPLLFRLGARAGTLEPTPAEHGQLDAVATVSGEIWAVGSRIATGEPYGLRGRHGHWEPQTTPTAPVPP
jgi:hypothetical protein